MKKSLIATLCLGAILLTACGKQVAPTDPPATTAPAVSPTEPPVTAPPQPPTTPDVQPSIENMYSASMPIRVENRKASNDTVISSFSSQELDLIIPDSDVAESIKNDFYGRIDLYRIDAEEIHARAVLPVALPGMEGAGGDAIIVRKGAEMVDAYHVI